ncbi:DHHA1 domain-containing protein [Terrilactibacillus sp. S3-3]|nr:DHHA1 domain-containing protein [Terrilactibacillus sp. S3-3]
MAKDVKTQSGVAFIAKKVDAMDMNQLRSMVDQLKNQSSSLIIVLASAQNGKVNLVSGITKDLVSKGFHAGQLVKEVAVRCGGGGGGRPDMAQAGGKDPSKIADALKAVPDWIDKAARQK